MNIKELRIGNLVMDGEIMFPNLSPIATVIHMNDEGTITTKSQQIEFFSGDVRDVNPLPITEEMLILLGFKKTGRCSFNIGDKYEGIEIYKGKRAGEIKWQYIPLCCKHIAGEGLYPTFIHQLQNLCFALTGIELEIKK